MIPAIAEFGSSASTFPRKILFMQWNLIRDGARMPFPARLGPASRFYFCRLLMIQKDLLKILVPKKGLGRRSRVFPSKMLKLRF